ncbi:alpha/beta fold hydrolase [Salinarimonas soli]|uniref:Alpha/beta hydrolase n=1 Tax=Salinarimonas soli TaxID=1638099 RepID=A0A5B2VC04_9HYPH|nr:alpha/beta hydrolase [Salinarimonas soli]KAA2236225.1 alpha/beta hydrolase [Salinarimonas soli]
MLTSDHWIATPGGRLFARSWTPEGSQANPTIVLFHDSLGCVELWREFPAALAGTVGHRVVAYDRLGFGRSDPRQGPLAMGFMDEEARESVPALVAALGLDRIVPFGHSVGGAMAVSTAARLPERCAAVVTVAAQAFVEDRTREGLQAAKRAFAEPGQVERLARYHGDKARWVLDTWIDTWLSPEFKDWTLDANLARVGCPVLAIHGDRDEYGSVRHPERIAALARGASRMRIIEACGHVPHREAPEAVLGAVADFLTSAVPEI